VQLQRRSAALLRLPPKTEESHATLLPHPSSSLPDLSRQSNRDPLRALRRPRSDAGMNSPSRCFEMHHRLAPPSPRHRRKGCLCLGNNNHGAKDDQVTACLGYDLSSDDCWSPDVEGRSSAIGGGHQFACGNRELVSSAHGGMYVRHAPVPCRHQVVLHQSCGSDRPHKACICRPC